MGVEKIILERGNGTDAPVKHDEVSLSYTGGTNIARTQTHKAHNAYRVALQRQRARQERQAVGYIVSWAFLSSRMTY
jgi:hypothetical protein